MATKQETADYIVDQIGAGASAKKMFGEYGLYLQDVLVGLICDGDLFIKPTDAGRAFIGDVEEAPPYPGAKNAFLISGERWDDGDWLAELARITRRSLPPPKPKASKAKQTKAKPKAKQTKAKKKKKTKTQ